MDVFPASDASDDDSSSSRCEESGYGEDEQGDAGLTVVGYACRVFRDDATAQWIDSNEHLVRWGKELVDRFDVRCLLDPGTVFARPEDAEAFEEDLSPKQRERLHRERHKDLLRIEQRSADAEAKRKEEVRGIGSTAADNESKAQDAQHAATPTYNSLTSSLPSHHEAVPKRLDGLLPAEIPRPRNQKVHDVILATARRVRQTPQLKVLLQLRTQDSPAFQFLREGSEMHAYYSFLVNADDATVRSIEGCKWDEKEPDVARQVLSASYFDSSDDDGGGDHKERTIEEGKDPDGKECVGKDDAMGQEETEQAMELGEQQDTQATVSAGEAEARQQQHTPPPQEQVGEHEDWADVQALLEQQQWHSNIYGDFDFDVDYARYAQADGGSQSDPQQRLKRARMLQGHFKLKLMHEGPAAETNRVADSPLQHQTAPQTAETPQQAPHSVAEASPSVQRSAIDYKRVRRRIQEILADLQC